MLPRRNLLGLRLIARLPTLRIGVHSLPGLLSLLLGGFRCIQRSGFVVGPHDWVLHRAARELPAASIEMGLFAQLTRGKAETIFQYHGGKGNYISEVSIRRVPWSGHFLAE